MRAHAFADIIQPQPVGHRNTELFGLFSAEIPDIDPEHRAVENTPVEAGFKHGGQVFQADGPFVLEPLGYFQPVLACREGVRHR